MRQPQKFFSIFFNPFRSVLIDSRLDTLEENMAVTKKELNAKLDTIIGQVAQEATEVRSVISGLQGKIAASLVPEDYSEELAKLDRISTALEAIAPSVETEITQPLEDTELLSTQEVNDLQTAAGAEPTQQVNIATNDDSGNPPSPVNPDLAGQVVLGVDLSNSEPGAVETLQGVVPSQTSVLVDDSAVSEQAKPPNPPVKLEETPNPLSQPLSEPTEAGVTVGEEPRVRGAIDASTPISRAQSEPETVEAVDQSGQVKNVQEAEGTTPDGIPLIG